MAILVIITFIEYTRVLSNHLKYMMLPCCYSRDKKTVFSQIQFTVSRRESQANVGHKMYKNECIN